MANSQKYYHCKVQGCPENHKNHFCKICHDNDSDHFSSSCKQNIQTSLKNSSNINSFNTGPTRINNPFKCRVPNCVENHEKHICRNCGENDSNHFTSQCPNQNSQNKMSNNFNYNPKRCRVQGCQENHIYHYCKICQSENSDHFSSDCPKKKFLNNSNNIENLSGIRQNNQYNSPNKGCKAKKCNENHLKHICKFCGDQDSDHLSSECPKKKMGYNDNNYQNSKNYGQSHNKKNDYSPPNLVVSKKKKISLPHKKEKKWEEILKIMTEIKNKKINSNKQLEETILELYYIGSKKKTILKDLNNLTFFINKYDKSFHFLDSLFPFMADLVLKLPKLFKEKKLSLLLKNTNEKIILTKCQVACLVACLFFGLIPNRPGQINFPKVINMRYLFEIPNEINLEKLACISNYFNNVMKWQRKKLDLPVTYRRVAATPSETHKLNEWLEADRLLNEFEIIHEDNKKMQLKGVIDVDFANKIVGGGTLTNGSVQEEIKFMMSPESIISMMLFESLEDNEIGYIEGTDQINEYEGYKKTFNFNGNFDCKKEMDFEENEENQNAILIMDALSFQDMDPEEQYKKENILRELNKSYLGFKSHKYKVIITGKWGCGVFQGDSQLKFLLQWISASMCQKKMLFSTFGELDFNTDFFQAICEKNKVKELLKYILSYKRKDGKLFEYIQRNFGQNDELEKEETKK